MNSWQKHIEVVSVTLDHQPSENGWVIFETPSGRCRYSASGKMDAVIGDRIDLLVADDGRLPVRRVVAIKKESWHLDRNALEDVAGWVSGSIIIKGIGLGVIGAMLVMLTMMGLGIPWYAVMGGTAITLLIPPLLSIIYGTGQAKAVSRHLVGSMGGIEMH